MNSFINGIPQILHRPPTVFFRSQLTTHKTDRIAQVEKIKILARIHQFLQQYVNFPRLNIPVFPSRESDLDYEEFAHIVRQAWAVANGPIPNVVRLLERNGLIVSAFPVSSLQIDAFSMGYAVHGQTQYYIVLGHDKNSAVRRQFDAAHELGHCVLHNERIGDEDGRTEIRIREWEANQFAAAFLMPKKAFLTDLVYPNKLDFYVSLKQKWKVSISSMIVRAFHLHAINANQYHYLMRQLAKRGWRNWEPLDDALKVEQPILFPKAIDLIIAGGALTPSQFLKQLSEKEHLSINPRDIESLLGLPQGTLQETSQTQPIIYLKDRDAE